MKKIIAVLVILILAGTGAFFAFRNKGGVEKYKFEKVMRGDIVSTVTATGTVNAMTTILVGTQVSGSIKNIYVDFNSYVKKGQLIAEIDPSTFEAQVDQAKANLLSAKANLEKAEASLADAKRILDRNRELFQKNLIPTSDLDTSETNYQTSRAQVTVSKAQIAQSEAALKNTITNLKYTKIISPVDGIVVSKNVDVGQTVAASFQTPTLFTIAQDLTKMQIDTSVDEADIGKIAVEQDVEFTVDAYPEFTFKGKVYQVRIAPVTVQNVVTYDVVVKVDNQELKLKPGMTANVSIIISVKKDILKVPNSVLRFKPSDKARISEKERSSDKERTNGRDKTAEKGKAGPRKKGPVVWVLQEGKLRGIPITTGVSDGNFTEVLSGELQEGQEIVSETLSKDNKSQSQQQRPPRMF